MLYVRRISTGELFGPVTPQQISEWLASGLLTLEDGVSVGPAGPWIALKEWMASQPPMSSYPGPATSGGQKLPSSRPGASPPPKTTTPFTAESLRLKRERAKQKAKRRTTYLAVSLVALFVFLLVVLTRPLWWPSSSKHPGEDDAVARRVVEDPAKKLTVSSGENLDSLIGTLPQGQSQGTRARQSIGQSETQVTSPLVAAAQAFGGIPEKIRDERGGISMQIEDISIDYVRLRLDQRTLRTARPYLLLKLRITNGSGNADITYTPAHTTQPTALLSWSGAPIGRPPYQRRGFTIEGQQRAEVRLGPGESVVDVYAFEVPPDSVKTVTLTVPGQTVGGKEAFSFFFAVPESNLAGDVTKKAQTDSAAAGDEESGIGPLETDRRAPGVSAIGTREQADDLLEDEAIPIPGVHGKPAGSELGSQTGHFSPQDLKKQEEEVRRKVAEMQEALDRQREKARQSAPRPTRRSQ